MVGTAGPSPLLERVRAALAPEYTVERELARGGMGIVFLGHDVALDRPVAIKVLQPELATAEFAERFIRESRILAKVSHPNVVQVHTVRDRAGLSCYVMDYLPGETLELRLQRGPLTRTEALDLGTDLLAAISAAHKLNWVHRDIKPGNIFLQDDRAVLTDFGVAGPSGESESGLTGNDRVIGTRAYMAPEQLAGKRATERSDIYATGAVLYEALTGRPWNEQSTQPEWSGIQGPVARVLRKALSFRPEERWPSAALFRQELIRAHRSSRSTYLMVAMILLVAAIAIVVQVLRPHRPRGGAAADSSAVIFQMLAFRGPAARHLLADSISQAIVAGLGGYADFVVHGPFPPGTSPPSTASLVLTGRVEDTDGSLEISIRSHGGDGPPIVASVPGTVADWRTAADSVASVIVYRLYQRSSQLDATIPVAALPKSAQGMRAWQQAELLFSQARWGEAGSAYRRAESLDSSCLLCSFRINDIDRWLDRPHEPARLARLTTYIDSFPDHYRSLIQAAAAPWPERLAILETATAARGFFLAWFLKGDELFHRGPLYGHHRAEAELALEQAVRLRPEFTPAWEHLAWVRIAEGDSAGALAALIQLARTGEPRDTTSVGLRLLLGVGFAYRFFPPLAGDSLVSNALTDPRIAAYSSLPMAPRLLTTFDAPAGAVAMGNRFAGFPDLAARRAGLLAMIFGQVALGQIDSAVATSNLLRERVPDPDLGLFGAQLRATLLLLDSIPDQPSQGAGVRKELLRYAMQGAGPPENRRRAAWLLALLEPVGRREGATDDLHALLQDEPEPAYQRNIVLAAEHAARGDYAKALALTDWSGEELSRLSDPMISTVVHFLRADWHTQLDNVEAASITLLWHEGSSFPTYPTLSAEPTEVDLAFGTLARWKRAHLLDRAGTQTEACRDYREVARLWDRGDARHRARADSSRTRLTALNCSPR